MYYSAWVEISGKVFVEASEVDEWLKEKYPELLTVEDIEEDDVSFIDKASSEQVREAFEELAQGKIAALMPTDEPIKFNEAIIDMTTFR